MERLYLNARTYFSKKQIENEVKWEPSDNLRQSKLSPDACISKADARLVRKTAP